LRAVDDPRMQLIGRCVDCHKQSLVRESSGFTCEACGRNYTFDARDILGAFPKSQVPTQPCFYNSPGYLQWVKIWEEMIQDWVIYKNRFYRWFSMSGTRQVEKFIQKNLDDNVPIVDLGCGHGQLFSLLDPNRCIGLDSNLEFLRVLKKRFPAALAIHGNFLNTPFSTDSLRCMVSLHTLEHLYFLAEALEEVERVMEREGCFFFSIPTEGGLGWKLGRRLVTGPHMKRKYQLDINKIMDIEHINDARRVLKFLRFYFKIQKTVYAPFSFLRILHVNSSISGIARPREKE
jgi:SAM-dependent methyltransferase